MREWIPAILYTALGFVVGVSACFIILVKPELSCDVAINQRTGETLTICLRPTGVWRLGLGGAISY